MYVGRQAGCTYVYMHVGMYACAHVLTYVRMSVCMYVRMYACRGARVFMYTAHVRLFARTPMFTYMYIYNMHIQINTLINICCI